MIVRELTTRLGFSADTDQARRYANAIRSVRRVAIATTAAVSALAGGTLALSRSLARQGNETAKAAVEAGLAADKYQELRFVLGQISQVTANELDRALGNTNIRIQRASEEGGRLAETLQELGFSQKQVSEASIGTQEAFNRIAELSQDSETSALAATAAYQLFGDRVARRLVPALQRGTTNIEALKEQARELGTGFSDDALDASEELTDAFGRLNLAQETLRGVMAEELLPAVQDVVDGITEFIGANRELIQQNIRRFLRGVITVLRTTGSVLASISRAVNNLAQAFGGWEQVISLVVSAITTLVGLRLVRFIRVVGIAISGLIAGVTTLTGVMAALARIPVVALFFSLTVVINDIIGWMTGAESATGKLIGSFDNFRATVGKVVDFIAPAIRMMASQFSGLFNAIVGVLTLDVSRFFDGLSQAFGPVIEGAIELVKLLFRLPGIVFDAMASLVRSLFDGIRNAIARVFGAANDLGEGVKDGFLGAIAGVFNLDLSGLVSSIIGFTFRAFSAAAGLASSIARGFAGAIAGAFSLDLGAIVESITGFASRAFSAAADLAGSIARGFAGAIAGAFNVDPGAAVRSIRDNVSRGFSAAAELGSNIRNGFSEKVEGAFDVDIEELDDNIRGFGSRAVESAKNVGARIRDGFTNAVGNAFNRVFGGDDSDGNAGQSGGQSSQNGASGQDGSAGQDGVDGSVMVSLVGQNELIKAIRGLNELIRPRAESDLRSSVTTVNRNINVNAEVSLDVPAGTTDEQRVAIERQAEEVFDQKFDRLIRQSMFDFQPQE